MSLLNKIVYIFSLLTASTLTVIAQDTTLLKNQAERIAKAKYNGDYNTFIDLTYPKLVEMSGGREAMQKLIIERIEGLKKQGIMSFDGSVGSPGPFFNAGNQIHCLIPESIVLKMFNGRYVTKSYLLAVSEDKGNNWTFLDVGNMPKDVLYRLVPDYNDKLIIPVPGKPMFFTN